MPVKRHFRLIFTLLFLIIIYPLQAFASLNELKESLDLLTSNFNSDAGIKIYSLEKKQVIYSKNENVMLNPASTTKLVTAAAAFRFLGPDHRFHTLFYLAPNDDLYIIGGGDPSLIIEELRKTADAIAQKKLRTIRNVVVDDTYFKSYTQPGLPDDKRYYNSYTGALSLNFNRLKIVAKPGKKVGDDAEIEADSGDVKIPIKNDVKTAAGKTKSKITLQPPPTKEGKELFTVSGQIPITSKGFTTVQHVSVPPLHAALTLIELLKERGINMTGDIFAGSKPSGSKLLYDHESQPLSEIVKDMNKFSNNFISEQLVKILGAEVLGTPGTTAKGIDVLKKYLNSLGISPKDCILVNGSGLTYDNRMTADQLIRIFQDMYSSDKIWPWFRDSLSIWGRDGTLRRRKDSAILRDRAMGKTGSLDFVKTIAGIVPTVDGETLAYAILLNGGTNTGNARAIQTKIVEEIANFRR